MQLTQNLPNVEKSFNNFCAATTGDMQQREWVKMCTDVGLVGGDTGLTITDVDLIWAKVKPRAARKIALLEFELGLVEVSKQQGVPPATVFRQVSKSKGPILKARSTSLRGPERFYYDKSLYTGTAVNGGPTTVDAGHGGLINDISELCDRSKTDVRGVKEYDSSRLRMASSVTTADQKSTLKMTRNIAHELSPDRRRSGAASGALGFYLDEGAQRAQMDTASAGAEKNHNSLSPPTGVPQGRRSIANSQPPRSDKDSSSEYEAPRRQSVISEPRSRPIPDFLNDNHRNMAPEKESEEDYYSDEEAEEEDDEDCPGGLAASLARVEATLGAYGGLMERDEGKKPRSKSMLAKSQSAAADGFFGRPSRQQKEMRYDDDESSVNESEVWNGGHTEDRRRSALAYVKSGGGADLGRRPAYAISEQEETPQRRRNTANGSQAFSPPSRTYVKPGNVPGRGPERFFYDKSLYTGSARSSRHGGSSTAHIDAVSDLSQITRGGPRAGGSARSTFSSRHNEAARSSTAHTDAVSDLSQITRGGPRASGTNRKAPLQSFR